MPANQLDLGLIKGRPTLAFCDDVKKRVWYAWTETSTPSTAADWQLTQVYQGFVFAELKQLSDWNGRPVIIFDDIGTDMLVATSDAPQTGQDWCLCRMSNDSFMAQTAYFTSDAGSACCIHSDFGRDVKLVDYDSLPQELPNGNSYHGRLTALKQALPLQEISDAADDMGQMRQDSKHK